ncbi:agamous-like MADS-box protein AGL61 [Aegilops tauschii subsp. strangulata]|uniref:agamous-like MADS-box protein AGL61 n=1 Tax=Aegilops tauschii subsp. strangulata TaxID=200361 RepID=UPI00098A8D90|nr:agamous-like MADS-box protein AGL23 [Aegilops tauschii subsp. strangulata]
MILSAVLRSLLKKDAWHVCFSKHKWGLFTKASTSTLTMLSGAQVGAVIFSPGCKAFSFGHSSFDTVVNHVMTGDGAELQGSATDNALQTLHRQHGEMRTELAERKK